MVDSKFTCSAGVLLVALIAVIFYQFFLLDKEYKLMMLDEQVRLTFHRIYVNYCLAFCIIHHT